jgi:PEP-CTERM motif
VTRFIRANAIILLMACLPASVHAGYTIDATVAGNYTKTEPKTGAFITPGSVLAQTGTYSAAVTDGSGVGLTTSEARNYFEFNLSQVTGQITGVTLQLFEPVGGFKYFDLDIAISSVSYTLRDASQDAGTLSANGSFVETDAGYAAYLSRYNDLGSGTLFGGTTVTPENDGTILSITLNSSAIAAIFAHEGGMFVIGGAVDRSALTNTFSNVSIFSGSNSGQLTQLVIQTSPAAVPEPSSLALVGIGGVVLLGYARRRKARVA